jgi:ATP:cob(I)alamin adenosyltransferase
MGNPKPFPKIATRTGDGGTTSLWCGTRVAKSDPRVVLNGHIDLALSALGRCYQWLGATDELSKALSSGLKHVQMRFVALMGEVACDEAHKERFQHKREAITEADLAEVDRLYQLLHDALSQQGRSLERWQMYGHKGPAAADFYFARGYFRACELEAWALVEAGYTLREPLLKVLNRISDVLFLVAVWLETPHDSN